MMINEDLYILIPFLPVNENFKQNRKLVSRRGTNERSDHMSYRIGIIPNFYRTAKS